jgi:uncharacterized protein (TIGR03546 family)
MYLSILLLFRGFVQTFTEEDSPKKVAIGFALGMMVGLIPKGNLVAILLATILFSSRASLLAGGLATAVFSWVGMLTDPLAHRIGLAILTRESWQPLWTRLYELPVVPWSGLNNTVVLGNLLLGLVLAYPMYRLSRGGFERHREKILKRFEATKADKVLGIADKAAWRV